MARIEFEGNLGHQPDLRFTRGGDPILAFRVADSKSRKTESGEWETISEQWLNVSVWGPLAEHLSARRVHVRSAGSAPVDDINPVVVQVLAERGVTLGTAYPKPLSDSAVRAADVIITMGCGDTCPYFPGKRYEDWDVADPAGQPIEVVREIRDDIQARVTTLLRDLLH